MKIDDEALRLSYQKATHRPDGAACPTPDELFDLAFSDGPAPGRRDELIQHLGKCADCAREYRVARAARPGTVLTPPSTVWGRALAALHRPALRFASVAATLLVAVTLSIGVLRQGNGIDDLPSSARGARETMPVTEPAHGAVLQQAPARLSFKGMQCLEGCRLVIYDEESTPLWQSETVKGESLDLPPEARQRLAAAGNYRWRIFQGQGSDKRQSPLLSFSIRP